MTEPTGLRLAVAGAGVFGLCVALRAVAAGAQVDIWDPAPLGDNASGVAGGMIAPVGEALFDGLDAVSFDLFRAGQEGWRILERLAPGLSIIRSGATFLFVDDALSQRVNRLIAKGALYRDVERANGRLFSADDWRVEPRAALLALRAAVSTAGGVFKPAPLKPSSFKRYDAVVLAAGFDSRGFAAAAPELEALFPIKGQIVRFHGGPADGPILRSEDVYIVPQSGGALAGATMEPGRADRMVEKAAILALRERALNLLPALKEVAFEGAAGVRVSTPDDLPMIGPSSRRALYLATGARRNGWLLAPLVSEILMAYLCGSDPGPFAAALHPRRFSRG